MQAIVRLTPHFTLAEATKSNKAKQLGIDNTPSAEELATIHRTAIKMEQVREVLGLACTVTSWFRGPAVNKAVGGVKGSQHEKGEAVDFVVLGKSPNWVVNRLLQNAAILDFDQLILEPTWVHISFCTSHSSRDKAPRLQYLDLSR